MKKPNNLLSHSYLITAECPENQTEISIITFVIKRKKKYFNEQRNCTYIKEFLLLFNLFYVVNFIMKSYFPL